MSAAASGFSRYAGACPHRITLDVERRPGNALNVEVGAPTPRCRVRPPAHWPPQASVSRWLASGGSALVLGVCSAARCPLRPDHCVQCGHRAEHHDPRRGCLVRGAGEPFSCHCGMPDGEVHHA